MVCCSLWLFLALAAVLVANWLGVSTALSEIVVGTVAQLDISALIGGDVLNAKAPWITFLAGTGAIVLTFLAGAELDPDDFRAKWKEAMLVGLVGFIAPFFGAAVVARHILGWGWRRVGLPALPFRPLPLRSFTPSCSSWVSTRPSTVKPSWPPAL